LPSAFPFFLRKCAVPFVIGPINGGLPWPPGFSQSESQRSWIDSLRNLYQFLPFSRSTFRRAAAIIAGSSQTYSEFAAHSDKLFFVAENGVNRSLCRDTPRQSRAGGKLEFIFLGALVPYKACDLALRAAASSLRNGLAHLYVVGDGPDRARLEQLAENLGIKEHVSFCGMLKHGEAMERLSSADVMVYPSVREYGGAVVVEALAAGVVPLVADFGGPGDTVRPDVGFKVRLTNESEVVSELERFLVDLTHDRDLLERLRQCGMAYVRENMTWDAKAQRTTRVLNWAAGRGTKPDFPPPRVLPTTATSSGKEPYRPQEA
jgi:glycosyltransferase involved in cell wall biosynthesis